MAIGVSAALAVIAAIVVAVLAFSAGTDRDVHAEAACSALQHAASESVFDGAMTQIKAVSEARKSSDVDLRAAANKVSPASQFPTDSPAYENPGDVQANAVAQWCKEHD